MLTVQEWQAREDRRGRGWDVLEAVGKRLNTTNRVDVVTLGIEVQVRRKIPFSTAPVLRVSIQPDGRSLVCAGRHWDRPVPSLANVHYDPVRKVFAGPAGEDAAVYVELVIREAFPELADWAG